MQREQLPPQTNMSAVWCAKFSAPLHEILKLQEKHSGRMIAPPSCLMLVSGQAKMQ
jgi:hypothetical protein